MKLYWRFILCYPILWIVQQLVSLINSIYNIHFTCMLLSVLRSFVSDARAESNKESSFTFLLARNQI